MRLVIKAAVTANSGGTTLYQGASVTGRADEIAQAAAQIPTKMPSPSQDDSADDVRFAGDFGDRKAARTEK
jgi:hypothetical protein